MARSLREHSPKLGARIVLVARNKSRAEATLARLGRSGPGVAHSVYFADLTRLAEMKRVAAEIANREPPIDVLINNAGALFGTRRLTEDGLEYTFALNHMSYFVVTEAHASSTQPPQASERHSGFRRSSIREELQSHEGLWSLKALQHPIYPPTCSEPAGHGRDRELSASWFRCNTLRR